MDCKETLVYLLLAALAVVAILAILRMCREKLTVSFKTPPADERQSDITTRRVSRRQRRQPRAYY